jgi:hypothetical protein
MTSNMDWMAEIDWCQLVYTDLCDAASRWHKRNKINITATVYGCSLIVLVSNSLFYQVYICYPNICFVLIIYDCFSFWFRYTILTTYTTLHHLRTSMVLPVLSILTTRQ